MIIGLQLGIVPVVPDAMIVVCVLTASSMASAFVLTDEGFHE